MNRNVCIHQLPEIEASALPDFTICARTETREQLLTALSATEALILVLDLDNDDAINTVINALEARPALGVVGVTGTSNLNHVIAAQRAGCKQITTRPLDQADLSLAVRRAANTLGEDFQKPKTIAVIGATGGAGATMIASHLAVELAAYSKGKVGLIDLDFEFGGVARSFDVSPAYTIADLASTGAEDPHLLSKTATELPLGVDVIARPPTIAEAHAIEENSVRSLIKLAARTYPYVVLDLPRKLDGSTGAAIELANKLLIVLQLTVPAIDNARRLITALSEAGFPQDRIDLVVNRYRKSVHACTIELVEQELAQKVFGQVPSDYPSVNKAFDTGQPLAQKNPVRTAIAEMAAKLIGPAQQPQSKSWFANLMGGKRPAEAAK